MEIEQSKDRWITAGIGTIGFTAILLVLTIYAVKFASMPLSTDTAHWGQFGDYFGGVVNPTLSFLALIALLLTLRLQSQELALSRKELQETRTVMEEQSATMKRQAEESQAAAEAQRRMLELSQQQFQSQVALLQEQRDAARVEKLQKLQPELAFIYGEKSDRGGSWVAFSFDVINNNAPCFDVQLQDPQGGVLTVPQTIPYATSDRPQKLWVQIEKTVLLGVTHSRYEVLPVTLHYVDLNGVGQGRQWQIVVSMRTSIHVDIRPNPQVPFILRFSNDDPTS